MVRLSNETVKSEMDWEAIGISSSKKTIIINPGFARCGTTAFDEYLSNSPFIYTPREQKELKYFMQEIVSGKEYLSKFSDDDQLFYFESSPPYCHTGFSNFKTYLQRIAAIAKEIDAEVKVIFCIRNMFKRAFSHYWHDINTQYSIYGANWKVKNLDSEDRFKSVYKRSFFDEVVRNQNEKFFPRYGKMINHAIGLFGEENVRVAHTNNLDACISDYLKYLNFKLDEEVVSPRIIGAKCPIYLSGPGYRLAQTDDGQKLFKIEGDEVCLITSRNVEFLEGSKLNLDEIVAGSTIWSRQFPTSLLPQDIISNASQQTRFMESIPSDCFLAGKRDELLGEMLEVPKMLKINEVVVAGELAQGMSIRLLD